MRHLLGLMLVYALSVVPGRAAGVEIYVDNCGQTLPDGEVGALRADLSCPPSTTAVRLGYGSTLNMNGYTIDAPDGWGVWCSAGAKCTINGGGSGGAVGEIHGAQAGIYVGTRGRLVVNGVAIRDCASGVVTEDWHTPKGASVRLTNVEITGSTLSAVNAARIKADTVRIEDNPGNGITGGSMSTLKGKGLTVTNNAFSSDCDVYGCEGINVGQVRGINLLVTGNAGIGIRAEELKLRKSTVIDNVRAGVIKDLVTYEQPRVNKVVCDVSFGWGSQSSVHWNVCSLDDVP